LTASTASTAPTRPTRARQLVTRRAARPGPRAPTVTSPRDTITSTDTTSTDSSGIGVVIDACMRRHGRENASDTHVVDMKNMPAPGMMDRPPTT
jgi:hypothetical protein